MRRLKYNDVSGVRDVGILNMIMAISIGDIDPARITYCIRLPAAYLRWVRAGMPTLHAKPKSINAVIVSILDAALLGAASRLINTVLA